MKKGVTQARKFEIKRTIIYTERAEDLRILEIPSPWLLYLT